MAMTKCKECGGDISTKAEACPKCGAKRVAQTHGCMTWIAVILAAFIMASFLAGLNRPRQAPKPKLTDAQCKVDGECWFERNKIDAHVACKKAITASAKFDAQFTDGIMAPLLSRWSWHDQSAGVMNFAGDQVKLQNGFGAYVRHRYICRFDPASKTVQDISITPGKF